MSEALLFPTLTIYAIVFCVWLLDAPFHAFKRVRVFVKKRYGMKTCPYCISFWVAVATSALSHLFGADFLPVHMVVPVLGLTFMTLLVTDNIVETIKERAQFHNAPFVNISNHTETS